MLERCLEWSQHGRHRKVVAEVERTLPLVEDHPQLEAALLIWKAQALLAMGCAEQALPCASRSWELEPSSHACHLKSNALEAIGDLDGCEELLRMGWRLFPEAVHLPVQLAVALSDQARLPEALDILDEVPIDDRIPDDLQVFLFGMRANLLGSMGRWAEAEEALREGLGCHPKSSLLSEARDGLQSARLKLRAEKALADSWRESLAELDGVAAEIDDAIIRCGEVNELSELVTIAARRLWRAYTDEARSRPHSPDPWGTALVFAVLEIDGESPSIAAAARSMRCSPSSVRSILKRLRSYLSSLDSEFRTRAFAGTTNPRLQEELVAPHRRPQVTNVVPFPTR